MAVIIDKFADEAIFKTLEKLNIETYKSADLDYLYRPVNTHPDMQIHFINDTTSVVAPSLYDYYKNILPESVNLIKGKADPQSTYPGDCAYNVARVGNRIIGNLSYTDNVIKEIYSELGFEFINVKQGYTKCNLCVVDSDSVITEDEGLYGILSERGINVLKIPHGEVGLKCFTNGFIGGASGFINPDQLAFCGDINLCSYKRELYSFVNSKSVDIILLSHSSLNDFGSILYFGGSSA